MPLFWQGLLAQYPSDASSKSIFRLDISQPPHDVAPPQEMDACFLSSEMVMAKEGTKEVNLTARMENPAKNDEVDGGPTYYCCNHWCWWCWSNRWQWMQLQSLFQTGQWQLCPWRYRKKVERSTRSSKGDDFANTAPILPVRGQRIKRAVAFVPALALAITEAILGCAQRHSCTVAAFSEGVVVDYNLSCQQKVDHNPARI